MATVKSVFRFGVLFGIGFVIATAMTARAGSAHYEISDWSANPTLVGDSTMPVPFNGWENAVFTAASAWNNVAGAWVNINNGGLIPLAENISVTNVPMGHIYVAAYAGGSGGPFGSEQTDYNYVLSQIQRSRIRMNKQISGWVLSATVAPMQVDYVSILIHELGHSMGVQHRTVAMDGTGNGYGTCVGTTANINTWTNQATMCEFGMLWTGAGSVLAAARSLHDHEKTDYAANY